jgi:hypothetical protein
VESAHCLGGNDLALYFVGMVLRRFDPAEMRQQIMKETVSVKHNYLSRCIYNLFSALAGCNYQLAYLENLLKI